MEQAEALKILADHSIKTNGVIVADIGSQSVWLKSVCDRPEHLYLSGPMGIASSVALGVAMSNPEKNVIAACGDGALAMNFSSLVTIANLSPDNLLIAVMDNGIYDFTQQAKSPSVAVEWRNIQETLPGFKTVMEISELPAYSSEHAPGLGFVYAKVKPASGKPTPFGLSSNQIHDRFKSLF